MNEQRSISDFMRDWVNLAKVDPKYVKHELTDAQCEELKNVKTPEDVAAFAERHGLIPAPVEMDFTGSQVTYQIEFFKELK